MLIPTNIFLTVQILEVLQYAVSNPILLLADISQNIVLRNLLSNNLNLRSFLSPRDEVLHKKLTTNKYAIVILYGLIFRGLERRR
jgi:hypothetical protein